MSDHNDQHQEMMRRITPERSEETVQHIRATKQMLANTRRFFDGLEQSEERSREYIERVKAKLENDIRRLSSKMEDSGEREA